MATALKINQRRNLSRKILWQDVKEDRGYRITVIDHNEKGIEMIYERLSNKLCWNPFTKQYESQTKWFYVDSFITTSQSEAINCAERLTKELENIWQKKKKMVK